MPDFNYNDVRTGSRDTNLTASGTILVPVQNGPIIQDDQARYIWRIRAVNATVAPVEIILYAAHAAAPAFRPLFRTLVPPGTTFVYPDKASPDQPCFRISPNTGVAPTQENIVTFADGAAGGQITAVSYSYYDKRA